MINWFKHNKLSLAALVITIGAWIIFGSLVPRAILDVIVYGIVGWFWMGGVVVPWVERKLEKRFK